MKKYRFVAVALALLISGCDVPELESPQTAVPTQPAQSALAESSAESSRLEAAAHVDPAAFLPDGRVDMSGVKDEPPKTNGIPREVTAKDPKKGKLSRRAGGYLGSTVQAAPWAENETKFQMIKYNLTIFEADKSRWPKSHQEFMDVFLPQYYPVALPLPELEPGDEYIYDPEDHLLKIWRPAEATPDIRAKYLGEETVRSDQPQPATDSAAPAAVAPQSSNPGSPNPNEPPPVTTTPREVSDLDPSKGKKSRAAGGYLGAVGGARFYAEHSLIFDQVRQALELYNAEHGNYPKSQEEFRDKIIRPNNISLPALDPGVEYLYSPEEHKLMVWRPEDPATAPESIEQEP